MQISKDDIQSSTVWPANAPAPLTRDQQIYLMTTARERHAAVIERVTKILKEKTMS